MRRLNSQHDGVQSAVLSRPRSVLLASLFLITSAANLRPADPNATGLAALRREQPSLTGAGVPIGHVEAPYGGDNVFQVNPSFVGQATSLFTWISPTGTADTFPNEVGFESGHANGVGAVFFGLPGGVAMGVQHVRNYDAQHYMDSVLTPLASQPDMVVNNSWVGDVSSARDLLFDNYAATRNVLFVSGMNNAQDTPQAPGSAYNGIGVGNSTGMSSIGPTADGRAKPDIVVTGSELVSYVTPVVSGAAALLIQAAARDDGGAGTAALATNSQTIKALLLNGAVKPPGWTNGITRPLDARWGAGEVNMYHSWLQLRGGRSAPIATITSQSNPTHPPTAHAANNSTLRGWDYSTIASTIPMDAIAHYYFNLTNAGGFTANVTLVWKRAFGAASAKNLDLFLYRMAGTNLVAVSRSTVDNVEHLFTTNLAPGRYNLQVVRRGGALQQGAESYALAWNFVCPKLVVERDGNNVVLSWPVNETGLVLQSSPSIAPPIQWQAVSATPFYTNGQNAIALPMNGTMTSFRLYRP